MPIFLRDISAVPAVRGDACRRRRSTSQQEKAVDPYKFSKRYLEEGIDAIRIQGVK
jgi:hypothetical protein